MRPARHGVESPTAVHRIRHRFSGAAPGDATKGTHSNREVVGSFGSLQVSTTFPPSGPASPASAFASVGAPASVAGAAPPSPASLVPPSAPPSLALEALPGVQRLRS